MVCASAVQTVPDVLGDVPYGYYDSWALQDLDNNGGLTFLQNPFQRTLDRWRWMACLPVSFVLLAEWRSSDGLDRRLP